MIKIATIIAENLKNEAKIRLLRAHCF